MAKSKRSPSKALRRRQPAQASDPAVSRNTFPIVGIGASAGGLEAMTQMLKSLPGQTGIAFVVVQHLDPTHESALTAILARSTSIPVVEAKNNMRLAPDHVYVIPPNKLMGILGRRLKLSPRGNTDTLLAIDHFLRSLADEEGNHGIGVILSGNGSDGTQGLLSIKAAGGITFAQDEKSAKYPAMPGSAIAAGCVDYVLPPERIASELARLAGHPYVVPSTAAEPLDLRTSDEKIIETILIILRQRMGVDFTHYKRATLQRRIMRRMVLQKHESLKDYADYLRAHTDEVKELYNDILIHVTGFFRDPGVFQTLKKRVFPRMIKGRAADEALRVWVPGCSTGEEAYSVAIALTEHLNDHRLHFQVQIFGTDINDGALDRARMGWYPESIKADVSPERLRRFFIKANGGYRINKTVREMCIFARQNVVVDPPFSNIDLVSCRNLLIYLDAALQRKAMPLFHYALRPGGFLVLGASETIGTYSDLFSLAEKKSKVYLKKAVHVRPAVTFGQGMMQQQTADERTPPPTRAGTSLSDIQKHADRILLTHFSPAGVIINRDLEVLQFRGHTGLYLEHAHGEASLNLLKMAREGSLIELRAVVSRAIKRNARARQERVRFKQNEHFLETDIEVIPFNVPPASERYYLVLFEAATAENNIPEKKKGDEKTASRRVSESAELTHLRDELSSTRESLQAIIEEQEATNEELRSANEEITSSNEELQSANEELETAKEELQSTNEELTTLNDELESRNSEMEQVNNDLHNLLSSVNIPILILGQDLRIRRYTSVAERMFNLLPGDVGRPITDLNLPLKIPDLAKAVVEVIDNLATKELEVQCSRGRWYSVRIRPYKTTENKIDGAIIAVLEIDSAKAGLRLVAQGEAFTESMLHVILQPAIALDRDLTVRFLNPAFCRVFQTTAEEAVGRPIYEVAGRQWDNPAMHALLEEILPHENSFVDFELECDSERIGRRTLRMNAAHLPFNGDKQFIILLSVEDVTTALPVEQG